MNNVVNFKSSIMDMNLNLSNIEELKGKEELFVLVEDGGVEVLKPTLLTEYIILSQAKKRFAALIVKLDPQNKYHAVSYADVIDPIALKEARIKFNIEKSEFDRSVLKYKEEHQYMFEEQPSIINIAPYARNFVFDDVKSDLTLEEAIQGYKYASAKLKEIDLDPLRTASRTVVKEEYKEEYKNAVEDLQKESGYPGDSVIKATVTSTVKELKTRLKLDRKAYESTTGAAKFTQQYVSYLIAADFNSHDKDEEGDEE